MADKMDDFEKELSEGTEEETHTEKFQLNDIDFDEAYEHLPDLSEEEREKNKEEISNLKKKETEERQKMKKRKEKRKRRPLRMLIFLLCLIAISVVLATLLLIGAKDIYGMYKADSEVDIEVSLGDTTSIVASKLADKGVISLPWLFQIVTKLDDADGTFKEGIHRLNSNDSYAEIILELQQVPDRTGTVDVMIKEGATLLDAANLLEEKGICKADDFIYEVNRINYGYDFEQEIQQNSLKFYRMEGYIFPDTYYFYPDTSASDVAKKIMERTNEIITKYSAQMKEKGMTLEETITLASLIQAEAGGTDQMAEISSVFHNRLENPEYPKLQSDPTILYCENVIKVKESVPNQQMYDAYNTYVCDGLPVGPICNPGEDAIQAALNPADTDYLYFAHNTQTGEVFYATTLQEHEQNMKKAGLK